MIRGIAFDLEGTVIDVEIAHHEGFIHAARNWGIHVTISQAIHQFPAFLGGGDPAVIKQMLASVGQDTEKNCQSFLTEKMKYYNARLKTLSIKPRPGSLKVINWLKKNGYKIAIASLTPTRQAEVLFTRSGIDRIFGRNSTVLLEDVTKKKPDPEVYLTTAERMGIDPEEQLVFEDSRTGVTAAKTAGSLVVGMPVYDMPHVLSGLREAGATRIFWDWREMNIKSLLANLNEVLPQ